MEENTLKPNSTPGNVIVTKTDRLDDDKKSEFTDNHGQKALAKLVSWLSKPRS